MARYRNLVLKLVVDNRNNDSNNPKLSAPQEAAGEGVAVVWDLATVYRNHAKDVSRWAAGLLGPPWDTDDVVQDVFIVVQRKLPDFKPRAKITTWLFEITRRVAMAKRRKGRWLASRSFSLDDDHELPSPTTGALELLEKREAAEKLYGLLEKLPEKYRTTLVLYELEELSGVEVAELTGTSLENVWVRLHRGRQIFQKKFLASQKGDGEAS